jgi:hypothetical protein
MEEAVHVFTTITEAIALFVVDIKRAEVIIREEALRDYPNLLQEQDPVTLNKEEPLPEEI